MLRLLFLNENALGHSSYLPAFAAAIARDPEVQVTQLDVAPLPPNLERQAAPPFRGAARLGLSPDYRRWRELASGHAARLTQSALAATPYDALVVNTQSVGLNLASLLPSDLPLAVCLDATFEQLRGTPWFGRFAMERAMQFLHFPSLRQAEQLLYDRAQLLFPWSEAVAESLRRDYGMPSHRIHVLPPSVILPPESPRPTRRTGLPQILFLGGDFRRKGGDVLLQCFQQHFAKKAELHLVTASELSPSPGVFIHRNVRAWSEAWIERWMSADLFVFPSLLETFGIVLLEAQAFSVPTISSKAGAAKEILLEGKAGTLLDSVSVESLRQAILENLDHPERFAQLAEAGHKSLKTKYLLENNSQRLLDFIRSVLVRN